MFLCKDNLKFAAVVSRLFSLGAYLPSWLISAYKKVNPSELLRLYLVHGYIEDAGILACEYIAAVLGTGTEYFGLPNAVHATCAPVWLPHNTIDQLLLELKEHSEDPIYHKVRRHRQDSSSGGTFSNLLLSGAILFILILSYVAALP